tara:strand:+ start:209 stop:409 length:201 start_codon:yes stop_codon:yes gene_type:complete
MAMMMEDKIALIEMLESISEDHPELEERLKKMGGVKVLAFNLGTDLNHGINNLLEIVQKGILSKVL